MWDSRLSKTKRQSIVVVVGRLGVEDREGFFSLRKKYFTYGNGNRF